MVEMCEKGFRLTEVYELSKKTSAGHSVAPNLGASVLGKKIQGWRENLSSDHCTMCPNFCLSFCLSVFFFFLFLFSPLQMAYLPYFKLDLGGSQTLGGLDFTL